MTKKGYSLLEMIVTLFILSSITLLTLHNSKTLDLSHLYYLNDYLYSQSEALLNKEETGYKDGIYFNSMGRINQARTIKIGNHNLIIHLGTGYITYE